MIARALLYLLINETRFHYPRLYRVFMQILSAFLTLLVYWLTSKSFGGLLEQSPNWQGTSYFNFILTGELILMVPLALAASWQRAIRYTAGEGLLDDFLIHPKGLTHPLSMVSASLLTREVLQAGLLLILGILFFDFKMDAAIFAQCLAMILAIVPAAAGLGLIGGAIYLQTGRGEGLLSQTLHLLAIFAGCYFPLTIFPPMAVEFFKWISPFTLLLENVRALTVNPQPIPMSFWTVAAFWAVISVSAGLLAMRWAAARIYRHGLPLFTHP